MVKKSITTVKSAQKTQLNFVRYVEKSKTNIKYKNNHIKRLQKNIYGGNIRSHRRKTKVTL